MDIFLKRKTFGNLMGTEVTDRFKRVNLGREGAKIFQHQEPIINLLSGSIRLFEYY